MSCGTVNMICLFVFAGLALASADDLARIDAIQQESSCLEAGGICTIAVDCPHGQLAKKRGLCPKQRSQGIECCHGISVKETRCEKRGGHCTSDYCNPKLISFLATDCSNGQKCCILVN